MLLSSSMLLRFLISLLYTTLIKLLYAQQGQHNYYGVSAFRSSSAAALSVSSSLSSSSLSPPRRMSIHTQSTLFMLTQSSFPPPRFDEFSEQLIGSWETSSFTSSSSSLLSSSTSSVSRSPSTTTRTLEVDEVMRRCGGAVQGIREPTIIPIGQDENNSDDENEEEEEEDHSNNTHTKIYLNRSNDGFIFFNNGCYTYGPTRIEMEDTNTYNNNDDAVTESEENTTTTNTADDAEDAAESLSSSFAVSLPIDKGNRVVFVCNDDLYHPLNRNNNNKNVNSNSVPHSVEVRSKYIQQYHCSSNSSNDNENENDSIMMSELLLSKSDTGEDSSSSSSSSTSNNNNTIRSINDITNWTVLTKIIQCSMPSKNQPWMLQRSKWTTKNEENDNEKEGVGATERGILGHTNHNQRRKIQHWVVTERASDFYKRILGTQHIDDDGDDYDEDDFVIQFGYYYYHHYNTTDTDTDTDTDTNAESTLVTIKKKQQPKTTTNKLCMVARHYSNRNEQTTTNRFNLCRIVYLEGY